MQNEFKGQIALVTAAAGLGLGQAVARRLAAGGARVVVTDSHERRTREVTAAMAADHPDTTVIGHTLDVGDRDQIHEVVAAVGKELGPIQLLVNNAAVNWAAPIWDYDIDRWDRTVAVNLTGAWLLCRAIMPMMRDAGGGAIVNVSSGAAEEAGRFGDEPVYSITKGGMQTLTRSCANDGGPFNIRSNTVSTGIIMGSKFINDHPDQAERALKGVPLGRHPTAQDAAEAVVFLLSDRASAITGTILDVNAGFHMRS